MTTQRIVTLVDDIDGSEAKNTVSFSYLGTDYEIDLNSKHEKALRKTLATYIEKARRTKANSLPTKKKNTPKHDNTGVREWARKNGWPELSNYGRIPAEILTAFQNR